MEKNNPITSFTPPKMVTIRQAAATGILPEYALRNGVKQGWIPHVKSGNKYFINYDKLLKILQDC